jgi:nucleoside-diphosphate-sugar epimerase
MNKNILIIGSSGLVGSQSSNYFANHGFNVIGVSRNVSKINDKIKYLNTDYSELEVLTLLNLELDHILFCASDQTQFMQYGQINFNIEMEKLKFQNLLGVSCQLPTLKSFIFISSAGALYKSNQIVNENSDLNICSNYSELKLSLENLLINKSIKCGFVSQILRVTNLYGPTLNGEIRGGFVNELIKSAINKSSFTLDENYCNIKKNFLYVEDLLFVLDHLLNKTVVDNVIVNVASEYSLSLEQVLEVTLKALYEFKLKPEVRIKSLDYTGNNNHEFDLGFLKKLIPGFNSTPLEKGLIQTLKYLS